MPHDVLADVTEFASLLAAVALQCGKLETGIAVFLDLRRGSGFEFFAALDPAFTEDPTRAHERAEAIARVRSTAAAWMNVQDVARTLVRVGALDRKDVDEVLASPPRGTFRAAVVRDDVTVLNIKLPS